MVRHHFHNRLLAALSPQGAAEIALKLSVVPLRCRQALYLQGSIIDVVYFPEIGLISQVINLNDGSQAEVGIIGNEGVLGTTLISGIATAFAESMVQLSGSAVCMSAVEFANQMKCNDEFRRLIFCYSEAFQGQVIQTAACNRRHSLEQRLARWLLMADDRSKPGPLRLSQEFLAMMLGVHRPSLTVSARDMQASKLIQFNSGSVIVLDRLGLEGRACECYQAVNQRFEALLGWSSQLKYAHVSNPEL